VEKLEKEEVERIRKWREETGLNFIHSQSEDAIKVAIERSGEGFADRHPKEQDEVLSILSSWYFYMAAEMGRIYANVVLTSNVEERTKLNMLKPVVEALKVKIETLKKVYDRRIRELSSPKRTEAD
jgi:hypothetical protein